MTWVNKRTVLGWTEVCKGERCGGLTIFANQLQVTDDGQLAIGTRLVHSPHPTLMNQLGVTIHNPYLFEGCVFWWSRVGQNLFLNNTVSPHFLPHFSMPVPLFAQDGERNATCMRGQGGQE